MAKRVGKYKVSNKESELSLRDGGNVEGPLTVGGNVIFTGLGATDPAVAGRLFTTGSVQNTTLASITGSASFVLASNG